MKNKEKKLTLDDLKLESFLTELDDDKLAKVQGGAGEYADTDDCDCTDCCTGWEDCGVSATCPQPSDLCPPHTQGVGCPPGGTHHC